MSARPNDARSLFAAAREDGPAAAERDAVFHRVALATGIAAGTAAVATAVTAAPAATGAAAVASVAETALGASAGAGATVTGFSMKLLGIGAAIGAVSTALGLLLAVTLVMPEALPTATRAGSTTRTAGEATSEADGPGASRTRAVTPGAKLASLATRGRDTSEADATAAKANADAAPRASEQANARADVPSDLAEEARLVTAARSALVAGDAARALSLVQATRKLGARALEPEELGLEARALRALGRADDAAATELVLRRRYPESALAR
jgi:hypothetical protein